MPKLRSRSTLYAYATFLGFILTSAAQATPQITPLGILPIANEYLVSAAQDISDNGEVVVGFALMVHNELSRAKQTAFRWTSSGQMMALPYLAGGDHIATADAISADGQVVVGASDGLHPDGTRFWSHATRWREGTRAHDLGTLPGAEESGALGVSGNGQHIVGFSKNHQNNLRAVLWHADTPAFDLGALDGKASLATAISGDGRHVVGAAKNTASRSRAFIWNKAHGMKDIGSLPGMPSAMATAISAQGDTVIGVSADKIDDWLNPQAPVLKGFIWHRASGKMQEIVNTLGGLSTLPLGVTNNGRHVVGLAIDAHGESHAFRWTPENGMEIETTLPINTRMDYATAVTPDGRYSVGQLKANNDPFRAQWR